MAATPKTTGEKLEKAKATLERLETENADPRAIGRAQSNIAKIQEQKDKEDAITTTTETKKATKKVKDLKPCICGCDETTRGRFFPGHDAKLKSSLLKAENKPGELNDIDKNRLRAAMVMAEDEPDRAFIKNSYDAGDIIRIGGVLVS